MCRPFLQEIRLPGLLPGFLFDNFIVHYGFPARIHSDQGQCFESNLIKEEHKPYIVREQPNPDIPVYIVQTEGSRKKLRTLHRNLLLPFMGLPCLDHSESSSDQSSGLEFKQDGTTISLVDIMSTTLVLPSSGDSELDSDMDAHTKSDYEASADADGCTD